MPGTVRVWADALATYGSMTLAQVLAPAIKVAQTGFEIDQTFSDQTQQNLDYFDDIPATAALYLDPDGTPRDVGTTLRNPELAKTYQLIARDGPDAFYSGALAQEIVETVAHPPIGASASHRWRSGAIAAGDLAAYTVRKRAPTRVRYRGLDVFGMGPPSSGGSTTGEALDILEGYDLGAMPREQALHLYLEASRFAFADRGAYVGDPDFVKVPLRGLLSKGFAGTRRALITDRAAASPVPPGNPGPFNDGSAFSAQASVTATRAGSTTHLTTSDAAGNVVAYTFTIESTGGSGLLVPGYGFLLNNELTDFNYDSTTHPNRVEGGKRPRSSIAPTIVLRQGKPLLALVPRRRSDPRRRRAVTPAAAAAPSSSNRQGRKTGKQGALLAQGRDVAGGR